MMAVKNFTALKYSLLLGVAFAPLGYFLGINKDVKFYTPKKYNEYVKSDLAYQKELVEAYARKLKKQLAGFTPQAKLMATVFAKYSVQDVISLARVGIFECPYTHAVRCDKKETIATMLTAVNQHKNGTWGNKTLSEVTEIKLPNGVYIYSYWRDKTQAQRKVEERKYLQEYFELAISVLGEAPEAQALDFGQTHHCNPSISACTWHKSAITNGKLKYLGNLNYSANVDMPSSPFIQVMPIGKFKSEISKHFFAKEI